MQFTLVLLACLLMTGIPVHAQSGGFKPMVVTPPPAPASGTSGFEATKGTAPAPAAGTQGWTGAPVQAAPTKTAGAGQQMLQDLLRRLVSPENEGEYFEGETGAGGEYFGPGIMEKCEQASDNALQRLEEAKKFRAACALAQKGATQRIAVNDYSVKPAYMFIFDENDRCIGKTMVAFGNGAGGAQVACGDNGSHLSPAGFHLTAAHHTGGGRFGPHNSLKMVGLQGQGSVGRGILIHGTPAPGTSSTWGCAGVPYSAYPEVARALGYGALVYNYFRPEQASSGCRNNNGLVDSGACRLDPGSPNVPNSTGGTPAVAWWQALLEMADAEAKLPPMPAREYISKGTEISIYRYLPLSDTYEITMVKEEAVGPNVVTPEALRTALGVTEPLKDFKKRLARDTGTQYVLKKRVPLLWGREVFRRQKTKGR